MFMMDQVAKESMKSRLYLVWIYLSLLYFVGCSGIYHPFPLFPAPESSTQVTPLHRFGRSCPASARCCNRPNNFLDHYDGAVLPDDLINANLTVRSKPCQCKCLCLDDPKCQVVSIIKPQTYIDGHQCLFSSAATQNSRNTLASNTRAVTYFKMDCQASSCDEHSTCEDDLGTKAAVCKCHENYVAHGNECKDTTTPPTITTTTTPRPTTTITEIDFSTYGGSSSGSSRNDNKPLNAFLKTGGYWHSGSEDILPTFTARNVPQAIWWKFEAAVRVVKFSFASRPDNKAVSDGAKSYVFWGSNHYDCSDQTNWVTLHEDNPGTPFTSDNTPKEVELDNETAYTCYGLKITAVGGRSGGDTPVTMSNVRYYIME